MTEEKPGPFKAILSGFWGESPAMTAPALSCPAASDPVATQSG